MQKIVALRDRLGGPNVGRIDEDDRVFSFDHRLNSTALRTLEFEYLHELALVFPDGLTLKLDQKVGDESLGSLNVTPATSRKEYEEFLRDLEEDLDCAIIVVIQKPVLIEAVFGQAEGRILLFLYENRVLETLNGDLGKIEQQWFEEGRRLFLILGQPNCCLVGPIVNVLGGLSDSEIHDFLNRPFPTELQQALQERVSTRAAETHWQGGVRFLLPEYLACQRQGSSTEAVIKPLFNRHLLNLILFSLANHTFQSETGWIARFEGRKRLDIRVGLAGNVPDETCDAWFTVYDWVYESRSRDKMAIVRNLLTLHPYDEASGNCQIVTAHAPTMLASARHHFDQLVGESVEKYFDKLKEANSYLQGKIDAVGQQVTSLADTLGKTLLGAVGFVVTTVLSKLLDAKSGTVPQLLLWAFVVYIAAMVITYYPIAWKTFRLNREDYERNERAAKRIFSENDLEEFVGSAFQNRCRLFQWTFWGTLASYAVIAALGWRFLPRLASAPISGQGLSNAPAASAPGLPGTGGRDVGQPRAASSVSNVSRPAGPPASASAGTKRGVAPGKHSGEQRTGATPRPAPGDLRPRADSK